MLLFISNFVNANDNEEEIKEIVICPFSLRARLAGLSYNSSINTLTVGVNLGHFGIRFGGAGFKLSDEERWMLYRTVKQVDKETTLPETGLSNLSGRVFKVSLLISPDLLKRGPFASPQVHSKTFPYISHEYFYRMSTSFKGVDVSSVTTEEIDAFNAELRDLTPKNMLSFGLSTNSPLLYFDKPPAPFLNLKTSIGLVNYLSGRWELFFNLNIATLFAMPY